MKYIKKSDVSNIDHHLLNDAFLSAQKKEKNPEKTPENKQKRDVIYFIKKYAHKYKIDINKILSFEDFIYKIEEASDDFFDLWVSNEVKKIIDRNNKWHNKLYEHFIELSEREQWNLMESYMQAIDNSGIVQIISRDGIIKYVNDMYKTISWDYRDIIWKKVSSMWWKLYHTNDFWKNMWETILSGNIWKWEIENPKINEKWESYITSTTITPVKNKNGEIIEFIAIKYNITESEKLKKELSKANQEFHEILDPTSQWFWVIDKNLVIQDVNESFCKMLGYKKLELIGKNIRELFDDTNKAILDKQVKNIDSTSDRKYHIDFTRKNGSLLPVVLKATSLYDENGVFKKAIAFITDITELRAYEQKLYDISIKDELTWIWNRRYFDEKLQKYFDEINSKKSKITRVCIALIDIDFFKSINDTLGHDVGDIVLKELGKRFLHVSKNNVEVFRIGGEEFGVIGTNISEEDFYEMMNSFRLYNEENPIEYQSGVVKFTISGGISSFDTSKNEKIQNPKALYKKTDILLYAAKHSGRNNIKTSQDI